MATKKGATKKAAKPAQPAKKSTAKHAAPPPKKASAAKAGKSAQKNVVKKAAPKKAEPAKKTSKEAPKPASKSTAKPAAKSVAKPAAKPAKEVPGKKTEIKSPAVPINKAAAKAGTKGDISTTKKAELPEKKTPAPAPQIQESKPANKPLEKQVKKEPAKPTKVVIPKISTDKSIKYEPDFTKSVLDSKKSDSSGPTMRYSDNELIEFRDLINRKLDTAKKELAYLQGLITRKDESGDLDEGRYMTMEDGSMSMEREQLSQMASRQITFIDHLEKAIMRIENKTYGICRVTGKLIDKARLRAVPHATLSIEAKQMMSR